MLRHGHGIPLWGSDEKWQSGPCRNEDNNGPAQRKTWSRNLESVTSFPPENRRLEYLKHDERNKENVKNETEDVVEDRSSKALWAGIKALILF